MEIKLRSSQMELKTMGLDAEMESVVLGKELGGATFDAQSMCCLYKWLVTKQMLNSFHFLSFFVRAKIVFRFLWISSDSY